MNAAIPANPLSTIQKQLLMSMRFWVTGKQRLQQPIDPDVFTMIVALNQAQIMRQQIEDEQRGDGESTAKAPDKLKTASNRKTFSEAFETYLGQLIGSGRIPLSYAIWPNAVPNLAAAYATTHKHNKLP
jgi:hypothetical protein